jgi:hypothetical protein
MYFVNFQNKVSAAVPRLRVVFPLQNSYNPPSVVILQGNVNYAVQTASLNKVWVNSTQYRQQNAQTCQYADLHLTNKSLTRTDPIWFVLSALRMRTTCSPAPPCCMSDLPRINSEPSTFRILQGIPRYHDNTISLA